MIAWVCADNYLGRDAVLSPPDNVLRGIDGNGTTALGARGMVFTDGGLLLDWERPER